MSETRIVCPNCSATNLLPSGRLGDGPKCGKCKEPLFQAHPVELSAVTFERHVQRNDIPVLVDFWAPWCGPCLAMAPAFEEAAGKLEPNVRFAKLNTEEEQAVGARLGIRSIPTMVLFRDGKEVARQSGAMMSGDILRWVESVV
jgi:thioredoxin 2